MSNQQKTKHISKQNGQHKKPYRPTFNNNNPYNKLSLNKFHQIQDENVNDQKKSDGFKLHKRKRDLQRLIKHCEQKGVQVDAGKKQQLQSINDQLGGRRKKYEKDKRKEFFLEQKYKDIKRIELRKVYKHLGETKANSEMSQEDKKKEIDEWEKKLRYIKHFPKTLKYISLFPSSKPFEEKTLQFQKKIMEDIEAENLKRVSRLNYYKSENETRNIRGPRGQEGNDNQQGKQKKSSILPTTTRQIKTKEGKKKRQVVDDFFVQEQFQGQDNQLEQQKDRKQQQNNEESSEESQIDEEVQVDDEDDISEQQDSNSE